MKTKLVLACAVLLGACKPAIQVKVEQIRQTENTSQWEIRIDRPEFTSSDPEVNQSCAIFNQRIISFIDEIQDSLKSQARRYTTEMNALGETPPGPFQLYVQDSVFSVQADLLSVRLSVYTMEGGANGMTNFYAFNYDLKKQTLLENSDLLSASQAATINTLLKANLYNPEHCFDTDPTVDNLTCLNVTPSDLIFSYDPFILGPHSCGSATISIPRSKLK